MTSGKVSKRRRREARVPPPPGARRQASPKVLIGAALAVALIVLAIVLGFVFTGGSSSSNTPARGSLAGGLPGAADAQRLFRGIPQHGNVLGSPKAPVTVVEYVDLQCPFCQEFETKAMPTLLSRYVRSGKVKIEARPIAFIGPDSERGRAGALAAGEQNRLFNYMQLLYLNQGTENTGWLDDAMATAAAASIPGLDVHAWSSARGFVRGHRSGETVRQRGECGQRDRDADRAGRQDRRQAAEGFGLALEHRLALDRDRERAPLGRRLAVPVVEALDAGDHADAPEADLLRARVVADVVRLPRAVREERDRPAEGV